jgi:hypothetical protein
MKIERIKDDSKKKMVGDLEAGQCFSYDDETTVNIKTAETDDHANETLCVDLEDGITFMATNNSLVIPIKARMVIEL